MRNSLIAVGSALLAATALYGSAAPATADTSKSHDSMHCGLGVDDSLTYHHVTHHGVFAGTRETEACKSGGGWSWGWDRGHDDKHWRHRNWPTSGNGNFVGSWPQHGFHHDD
ncbi:hypothetical protein [Nonomuraea sp. NPDC005650]|uniref:hypothetical protein n=1 Tax=Nonomuraea sp. NPDC005650 TaxID=3157045 RepID=UPI0033A0BF5B